MAGFWQTYLIRRSGRTLHNVPNPLVVLPRLQPHAEAPQPAHVRDDLGGRFGERAAPPPQVPEGERAIAVESSSRRAAPS